MLETENNEIINVLKIALKALDEKQARNIKILDVSKQTTMCNYFIICDGKVSTHMLSLAYEVEEKLAEIGYHPKNNIKSNAENWIVLDYSTVIIHIFDKNNRDFYQLDKLWQDSESLDKKNFLQ